MFDFIRNNNKIAQVILGLIALTFVFFGIDGYVRGGGGGKDVATIGDTKITQQQFQQELRERQEQLRSELGPMFDAKMMDMPEIRQGVLEGMIDRSVLLAEARKARILMNDETLGRTIARFKEFQVDGKFSPESFESVANRQGLSVAGLSEKLREELSIRMLTGGVERSSFPSKAVNERVLSLLSEKREVLEYRFLADSYLAQVKLEDGAARKYYENNSKQFEIPEQAKAEFVVLSQDALAAQAAVSDKEIKEWYDNNRSRYVTKDVASARTKAEAVLKEVRVKPDAFAELAKKYSKDPGSAANGGDLGFFARSAMVKPFADAAYKLKEGDVSGLVESEFGIHIIKLTGIRAAKSGEERRASHILIGFGEKEMPLAEARAAIETELKRGAATRKFAEAAEGFTNAVYEQADSLKPAAEKYKLAVQQSGWLGRTPNPANGPLGNEKLLKALFSEDSVKNRRNTEAVEIAANTLVSARIVDYKPAALQPFENVKATIEELLKRQEAQALAKKEGEDRLAALKKGGDEKVTWSAAKAISRMDARLVPPPAVPAIFKLDSGKLPAFAGVEIPAAGYALYKLVKVGPGDKIDDERRQAVLGQLGQMATQEEMQAYLSALKARYKVQIDKAALEASKEK